MVLSIFGLVPLCCLAAVPVTAARSSCTYLLACYPWQPESHCAETSVAAVRRRRANVPLTNLDVTVAAKDTNDQQRRWHGLPNLDSYHIIYLLGHSLTVLDSLSSSRCRPPLQTRPGQRQLKTLLSSCTALRDKSHSHPLIATYS